MQKVPHIHIFGSSTSDWLKRSPDKSKNKLTDTWTSSYASGEFRTPYRQSRYDSQLSYKPLRRSNSQRRVPTPTQKPFSRDYYANAVRICDEIRLRDTLGHEIQHLNSPYLVKGCRRRRQLKHECVQCKEQTRVEELRRQRSNQSKVIMNNNIRVQQQVRQQQYIQQLPSPMVNSYMVVRPQQQQLQQQQITNGIMVNAKPMVSFQYVANSSNQVRYPTFRVMEKEERNQQLQQPQQQPQFRQLVVTQNNNLINQNTSHNNYMNSTTNTVNLTHNPIALGPTKRPHQVATLTAISRKQSHQPNSSSSNHLPQLSGLISELEMNGELGQSEKTKMMLDQLEQAARKELLVRRKCINQLDDLIEEYGKEVVQERYEKQQKVVKTRTAFFC